MVTPTSSIGPGYDEGSAPLLQQMNPNSEEGFAPLPQQMNLCGGCRHYAVLKAKDPSPPLQQMIPQPPDYRYYLVSTKLFFLDYGKETKYEPAALSVKLKKSIEKVITQLCKDTPQIASDTVCLKISSRGFDFSPFKACLCFSTLGLSNCYFEYDELECPCAAHHSCDSEHFGPEILYSENSSKLGIKNSVIKRVASSILGKKHLYKKTIQLTFKKENVSVNIDNECFKNCCSFSC